jgi:hypothetical protein
MNIVKIPELKNLQKMINSTNSYWDKLTNERYEEINGVMYYCYPCTTDEIDGVRYFQTIFITDGTDMDKVKEDFTNSMLGKTVYLKEAIKNYNKM